MAAVLPALVSRVDGALEVDATVLDADEESVVLLVDGAAAMVLLSLDDGAVAVLVLLSVDDGAVAVLVLLSLDDGAVVAVDAVLAALSSWRPQPASAAATARAVAASVSFFMGLSLLLTTNPKILGGCACGPGPHAPAVPVPQARPCAMQSVQRPFMGSAAHCLHASRKLAPTWR
jgi:hypothetical protein